MPAAKKKPVARKATAKKTVTRKPATRRKSVRYVPHRTRETQTFLTVRPSIETIYWIVLGVVVIALVAWVLRLTTQIDNLYNQVEINDASSNVMTPAPKTTK